MEFLNNYGIVIFSIIVLAVIGVIAAVVFTKLPRAEQIAKIKEVLLTWVVAAEKELGGGTGQVKLSYVYDLFVSRFPTIARIIKFETFSFWVDEALERMAELLKSNENLKEYVKNEKEI